MKARTGGRPPSWRSSAASPKATESGGSIPSSIASPRRDCAGKARARPVAPPSPLAGGTRPGVAEARGRDLRRRLVDEDPADPVRLLRLDDDLEVPVVVVADRRPVPL